MASRNVVEALTSTPELAERGDGTMERRPVAAEDGSASAEAIRTRLDARGKFLFAGAQKLYIRGATYGTFSPNAAGELYPPPPVVAGDFAAMAKAGLNAVRTYTPPPPWLLDTAAEHGLYVMVGHAWEQHVDFLDGHGRAQSIIDRVRAGVAASAGHPAVFCHSVGNEIPSHVVRWLGRRRVERHIARLYDAAKHEDPEALVTYVNYPPTEYLQLPFLDLMCFNVYLEDRRKLDAYLARLHNIADGKPLVMAELGLDSRTHGQRGQAAVLDWQIRTAFASGCAGAFVFAWTDEWYVSYLSEVSAGGTSIDDWDFGLMSRDRRPKPALDVVGTAYRDAPFEPSTRWPRVSVVVCTFNGERTLGRCLEELGKLDYPDYEVIVVNDGSTDSSATIAAQHDVRLVNTGNRGLACARNTGLDIARGEIVAYLDDDARPDPHWLRYLALAFEREQGYAGVGGPNLPPRDCAAVAACVADAPGGPMQVLISDREAEHIPGCNMAFRKTALEEIGGFDPRFRVAGDDVDICWRLLGRGHKLGFSPAAVVWHEPRGSVRAYWRQQRGYGEAEALLEQKWPDRYRTGGHARWHGRLYGRGVRESFGRWRVYYGTWGSELFQSLYAPARAMPSFMLSPEWVLMIAVLAVVSAAGFVWAPLFAAAPLLVVAGTVWVGLSAVSAARGVSRSRSAPRRARRWALTTLLHLIQPLARGRGRWGSGLRGGSRRRLALPLPFARELWASAWESSEKRTADIESRLRRRGGVVARGGAYDRWDLEIRAGWLAAVRIRSVVEEHGGGHQLVRIRATPRFPAVTSTIIAVLLALSVAALLDSASTAAAILGATAFVLACGAVFSAGGAMAMVVDQLFAAEPDLGSAGGRAGEVKFESR